MFIKKPPLGVMPLEIFLGQRIFELQRALEEYKEFNKHDIILAPWGFHPKGRGYYKKCMDCKRETCDFECYSVGETLVLRKDIILEINKIKKYFGYEKDYEIETDTIKADATLIKQKNILGSENWDYTFCFKHFEVKNND